MGRWACLVGGLRCNNQMVKAASTWLYTYDTDIQSCSEIRFVYDNLYISFAFFHGDLNVIAYTCKRLLKCD